MPKKIILEINPDTEKRIMEIVNFENIKNKIKAKDRKIYTIESFIKGSIFNELKRLEDYYALISTSGLDSLSKPFKIKNRFKDVMNQKGIKAVDVVKLTGINKSNLSQILNNKTQPSLDYFIRIWILLDCPPIEKILYREDEQS